jgi:hypothetical protein
MSNWPPIAVLVKYLIKQGNLPVAKILAEAHGISLK